MTGARPQPAGRVQRRVRFADADDNNAEEDHRTGADLIHRIA